jgi:multimeric flavodoxin WrbA
MPRTIALFASARRQGNTGQLVDRVADRLGIEVIDLAALNIAAYDYDHRHRSDDFEPLMERVLTYEQIVFASPVYWYAVSSTMKIFLDRITDLLDIDELLDKGRHLRGKRAFVICTSIEDTTPPTFIEAFEQTFAYLGMSYGGSLHANCTEGFHAEVHAAAIDAFVALVRGAPPPRS